MRRIKLKRNREVGGFTYLGDAVYEIDDGIADGFIRDGHAVDLGAVEEPVVLDSALVDEPPDDPSDDDPPAAA
jgi:hypothetical protein